jgi:hypothetical protein
MANIFETASLLKQLEEAKDEVEQTTSQLERSSLEAFLVTFKLAQGNNPVSIKYLYQLYKLTTQDPVATGVFNSFLRMNFLTASHQYGTDNTFILLNLNNPDIKQMLVDLGEIKEVDNRFTPKELLNFEKFVAAAKLKDGKYWVSLKDLFKVYKRWKYSLGIKNININLETFHKKIKMFFETKHANGQKYVKVDDSFKKDFNEEGNSKKEENTKEQTGTECLSEPQSCSQSENTL